jgi:Tol biopolymer transport system component
LLRIPRGAAKIIGAPAMTCNVRTAAALLSALVVLVTAAAASSATRAASGLIAYSDAGGSLYASSLQGTNPTTLFTSDTSTTLQALAVSPDGKQVLAIEYGNQTQLVLVPVAGGAPTPVSGADGAGSGSFSPDGTKLVFSLADSASATLSAGIYTVSVSGGTPKLIAATPSGVTDALPEYAPDGTKLAFVRDAFDAQGNETVSLELMPSSGGSPTALTTTGLAPNLGSGGGIAFSPDGTTIAFGGDYSNPGIFTVPVAGGNPTQLTSDYDYWPSFSADGSKVYFSRDAISTHADDNANTPVAPSNNDLYELWTVKKDGSGAAVVAEGDFENLALPVIATSSNTTTSTPSPTTTPAPGPSTAPSNKNTPATTAAGKTSAKAHKASATSISVTTKGSRYTVKWKGKATSWSVILKVGIKTATAKVKGSLHSHTFVLAGAHGAVSARVKTQ